MRNEQIRSIEWLRAVAAIFVVAYHTSQGIEFRTGFLTSKSTDFGASGVDIFFVVSGFIMTVTTAHRPLAWHEFLVKRVIRLMPIYWTLTLIKAASLVVLPSLVLFSVFSLPNIITSLLLVPYDTPGRGVVPLIIVAWTLEIELMFYVVFAVSKQLCGKAWMVAVAGCFGTLTTAAALCPGCTVLHFYAQPIIFEFLFGIALALLFLCGVRLPGALAVPILALATATLLMVPEGSGAVRLVTWGLPATVIVGSAVSIEQCYGAWRWRPMVFLGNSSYSLYLTHSLAVPFLMLPLKLLHPGELGSYFYLMPMMVLQIGLGCIHYRFIERPLTGWMQDRHRDWQTRQPRWRPLDVVVALGPRAACG